MHIYKYLLTTLLIFPASLALAAPDSSLKTYQPRRGGTGFTEEPVTTGGPRSN